MPEELTVKLVKVFKVAWWCRLCWARGEIFVPRGVEAYTVQAAADNAHLWIFQNCRELSVRVEWDARREVRLTRARFKALSGGNYGKA